MKASEVVQAANDRGQTATASNASAKTGSNGFSDALIQLLSLSGKGSPAQKDLLAAADSLHTGTAEANTALTQHGTVMEIPAKLVNKPEAEATEEDASLLIKTPTTPAIELAASRISTTIIEPDTDLELQTASNAANLHESVSKAPPLAAAIPDVPFTTIPDTSLVHSVGDNEMTEATLSINGTLDLQPEKDTVFIANTVIHGQTATTLSIETNNYIEDVKVAIPVDHKSTATQTMPAMEALARQNALSEAATMKQTATNTHANAMSSNSATAQGVVEQQLLKATASENRKPAIEAGVVKQDNESLASQLASGNGGARQIASLITAGMDSAHQPNAIDAAKAGLLTPTAPVDSKTTDTSILTARPAIPLNTSAATGASPEIMIAAGRNVQWMLDQGISRATMQLHPAELGSLRINIEVRDEQLAIQLSATQAGTRDALEVSIPRLREQLADQGFTDINIDLGKHHSDGTNEDSADNNAQPTAEPELDNQADLAEEPTTVRQQLDVEQGLVDMFA